jgi:hypothetical protein
MHAKQWGCNRSAAKEEEDKNQQQKSWNESEQTQKRVHAKRTYLPTYLLTYQSIDLPNLLTCLQNRTSRLCYFWGSVLWCGQKWLYYPWGDLARFGYKLNVKIVYRKQNPTGLSFGYLLESLYRILAISC